MQDNNLFAFATKELSTDAMICWMVNWINYKNSKLSPMAQKFLATMLGKEFCEVEKVDIVQQWGKIDVLLILDGYMPIIIEDKTFTSEHDDQISNYKQKLRSCIKKGEEINNIKLEKAALDCIRTVYLKIGNFYAIDEKTEKEVDCCINRQMLENIIQPYIEDSPILKNYFFYLTSLDEECEEYQCAYRDMHYEKAFEYQYQQYLCMKTAFPLTTKMWGEEKNIILESSTSFGRPYTWAWLWGQEGGYWLGFRLDKDKKGAKISFKLYRNKFKDSPELLKEKDDLFRKIQEYVQTYHLNTNCGKCKETNGKSYNESEIAAYYFEENRSSGWIKELLPMFEKVMIKMQNDGVLPK